MSDILDRLGVPGRQTYRAVIKRDDVDTEKNSHQIKLNFESKEEE
ncbi:hypothetical protein [Alteribacter natronophilus]|nr:hypothetical protein [Alteribacter natronophilus]